MWTYKTTQRGFAKINNLCGTDPSTQNRIGNQKKLLESWIILNRNVKSKERETLVQERIWFTADISSMENHFTCCIERQELQPIQHGPQRGQVPGDLIRPKHEWTLSITKSYVYMQCFLLSLCLQLQTSTCTHSLWSWQFVSTSIHANAHACFFWHIGIFLHSSNDDSCHLLLLKQTTSCKHVGVKWRLKMWANALCGCVCVCACMPARKHVYVYVCARARVIHTSLMRESRCVHPLYKSQTGQVTTSMNKYDTAIALPSKECPLHQVVPYAAW